MIGATAKPVAMRPEDLGAKTLEELLPFWNRLVWWTTVRPMFRRMLEVDLTMAESVVLHSLQRGPLTVAEVGECLYISHSAASRAVDRLVRDGFVSRQENPEDRRQKQLTLTAKGGELVGEMESLLADRLGPVLTRLNDEEREQLRSLLVRMIVAYAEMGTEDDEGGRWPGCGGPGKGHHHGQVGT